MVQLGFLFDTFSFNIHRGLFVSFICLTGISWLIGYYGYSITWAMWLVPLILYWTNVATERHIADQAEKHEDEDVLYPDHETAEWVNNIVKQLWEVYPFSISTVLTKVLEPPLRSSKPFFVKDVTIEEMSLGRRPPKVRKVKTFHHKSNQSDVVFMEERDKRDIVVDVKFRSSTDLQFTLNIHLFGVNTSLPFLITDIFLSSWIRLTIRLDPFGEGLLEYLQVSAVSEPTLIISVQPLTSVRDRMRGIKRPTSKIPDLMQVPLIREWLNITFVTELKRTLRFPQFVEIFQNDLKVFLGSEQMDSEGYVGLKEAVTNDDHLNVIEQDEETHHITENHINMDPQISPRGAGTGRVKHKKFEKVADYKRNLMMHRRNSGSKGGSSVIFPTSKRDNPFKKEP